MDVEELRQAGIEVVALNQLGGELERRIQIRTMVMQRRHDRAMEVVSGTHNHRQTKER